MLAGIVITILVLLGFAIAVPWFSVQGEAIDPIDEDPANRFSDSMKLVHDPTGDDAAAVSTPLTRRAELAELRLLARRAARRRRMTARLLLVSLIGVVAATLLGWLPAWSISIPVGLLVAFVAVARFSVVQMRRRFDARLERVAGVAADAEETTTIDLNQVVVAHGEESTEFSVDLSAPAKGMLWDPIPVTAPTYVSKPLVPRTVRTIDLAAPMPSTELVVPTADNPAATDDADVETEETNLRAVGE